ncbi:MAG TPA: tetratricopeptide repeat protein [Thermoanaerobaculia bacterium]|nr:tetratricopeptide repeat protein [Thermoanaerobaculia bacterium]
MPRIHPDEITLQGLADSLRTAGLERVLAHLIACRRCQDKVRELLDAKPDRLSRALARVVPWPGPAPDYAPALRRGSREFLERLASFEHERAEAATLWTALLGGPPERFEPALAGEPRYRTWGFVEAILEESRERTYRDPRDGERFGEIALAHVGRLDPAFYGSARLTDLSVRCLGRIANARRVRADLGGAEEAFARAEALLREGTRDPLERAELWSLKASLRREQRRLDDAARLLARSIETFRSTGEEHRAARCLVTLANVARTAGQPERAISLLREALPLLDTAAEPRLEFCARHNLISFLAEAGQFLAARRLLAESRPVYRRFPEPWVQLRKAWVEGRIAAGLGQLASAERSFLLARDGFVNAEMASDAAQVAFELAGVYARQDRYREIAEIARGTLALFRSLEVPRESLAAIALLVRAAERGNVPLEAIRQAAAAVARLGDEAGPQAPAEGRR